MANEMNKVSLKLKQNRNPLDIRKIFLMSREALPWHMRDGESNMLPSGLTELTPQ